MSEYTTIGDNLKAKINGNKLILSMDLSVKGVEAQTGRSMILGSSRFAKLDDMGQPGVMVNVMLIRSKKAIAKMAKAAKDDDDDGEERSSKKRSKKSKRRIGKNRD